MDPYKYLNLERNPDGSLTRRTLPLLPAKGEEEGPNTPAVPFKDVPLNPAHYTWLRIYLPGLTHHHQNQKLPILLYIHGGGFILLSASDPPVHDSCSQMARQLPALVLSLEYRLAPENPLPAAYDDAVDAILWLRQQAAAAVASDADPWLRDHGDFSRCFLKGGSAGANIAYHAGLRALALDLEPMKVAGIIFNQPFFGGEQRTESEVRLADQKTLPLPVADLMWELSLPTGSNRDHEFCNPMLHQGMQKEEKRLPRCLVRGHVGDSLIDRQREFAKMLEKRAVSVVAQLEYEGFHGVEYFDPSKADALRADVKRFIYPSVSHNF